MTMCNHPHSTKCLFFGGNWWYVCNACAAIGDARMESYGLTILWYNLQTKAFINET